MKDTTLDLFDKEEQVKEGAQEEAKEVRRRIDEHFKRQDARLKAWRERRQRRQR